MAKSKLLILLILALFGSILAFWGGLRLFAPSDSQLILPNYRVSVEEVPPITYGRPYLLNHLVELAATSQICEPEVPCLPDERPVYTSPAPPPPQILPPGTRIAILIDDIGLMPQVNERLIRLPAPVTLSFLSYAPNLEQQIRPARAAGHEIMLHLPMEPIGQADPGPEALLTALDDEEIENRIVKNLHAFADYAGINNHMGSKFTTDRRLMELFFKVLRQEKGDSVFFLDSRTGPNSVAADESRRAGFKTAVRDVFLDDRIDPESIRREFANLEEIARTKGFAIAIGHPHALTLSILEDWLAGAPARGIQIVPVAELVK